MRLPSASAIGFRPELDFCSKQIPFLPESHGKSPRRSSEGGSVLVIVLWIAFGLVAITLYFANSMSLELRASDNRVSGLAAEQAVEAGARYASYVLATRGTNGMLPDYTTYYREAVPVGTSLRPEENAHFWFIGRSYETVVPLTQPFFALVDEASKLNLNTLSSNMLELLPRMTADLESAILEWRSTNSISSQTYNAVRPPYQCKSTNYETVDELRLVYGANMDILLGEDLNRNGVLDPDEYDENRNSVADPGLLEYMTVYSREPNTRSDGSARINIQNLSTASSELIALLQTNNFSQTRISQIQQALGLGGGAGAGAGGRGGAAAPAAVATTPQFGSPLAFYNYLSGRNAMTSDEFALIANDITVASGTYIQGRINVATASPTVLSCLPGMTIDLAQQLVSYRQTNPLLATNSIAWIVEALGQNNASVLQTLAAGDYLTTQSYQFTADVAAVGPYGRGYRRVRFVFDMSDGTPKIVYRQDLSHLGWALGREVRQMWSLAKDTRR